MTNLFSSFDPNVRIIILNIPLNWVSSIICILIISKGYWLINSQFIKTVKKVIQFVSDELLAVFGIYAIGCMLYAISYMLRMLYAICYMLYVICYWLYVIVIFITLYFSSFIRPYIVVLSFPYPHKFYLKRLRLILVFINCF